MADTYEIIVHQFPRGLRAPSASPFALKLETWLRMAKIDYKNQFGIDYSSKGKIPWIEFNGLPVADSQLCIEFLAEKLGKDLSSHLSDVEKGIERAYLKMTEESLFWCLILFRLVYEQNPELTGIPKVFYAIAGKTTEKRSKAQGYGLHTKEEVTSIGIADLKAINDFIGNKRYFFGNQVSNVDASLFGMLCQIIYNDRGTLNEFIMEKCQNIVRYVENIRQTYWPDWDLIKSKI